MESPGRAQAIRGRGAAENPANRFERLHYDDDCDEARDADFGDPDEDREAKPPTVYYRDTTRGAFARNDSPDVPFDVSINPYRGCMHGCIYCYARPTHEYLGFSAGLDFETKIMVKEDAPALVRQELSSRKWKPQVIGMSGVTDAYQPIERRLRITRGCLEVLAEFRNPVGIVTKNGLVARDADLLGALAAHEAAVVNVSITSLDPKLQRTMEPRASHPTQRLRAIRTLADAGVPVGVMVAPIVPGLNDHEVPAILAAAAEAGARFAGRLVLRLPHGVKELFAAWLERHYPDRKDKVLNRIREHARRPPERPALRHERHARRAASSPSTTRKLFEAARRRAGLDGEHPAAVGGEAFRRPSALTIRLTARSSRYWPEPAFRSRPATLDAHVWARCGTTRSSSELLLSRIDGRGYKAYKDLRGHYELDANDAVRRSRAGRSRSQRRRSSACASAMDRGRRSRRSCFSSRRAPRGARADYLARAARDREAAACRATPGQRQERHRPGRRRRPAGAGAQRRLCRGPRAGSSCAHPGRTAGLGAARARPGSRHALLASRRCLRLAERALRHREAPGAGASCSASSSASRTRSTSAASSRERGLGRLRGRLRRPPARERRQRPARFRRSTAVVPFRVARRRSA